MTPGTAWLVDRAKHWHSRLVSRWLPGLSIEFAADIDETFDAMLEAAARRGAPAVLWCVARDLRDLRQVARTRRGDAIPSRLFGDVSQDLRYSARSLKAHPLVSGAIVISLALGIGATTAVFTVTYAALLKPLPVPRPGDLVQFASYDATGDRSSAYSYSLYRELRDATSPGVEPFALLAQRQMRLRVAGGPTESAVVEAVTGNYFEVMQVGVVAGRPLQIGDDGQVGGATVAVLSDRYWERRFGRAADAVGRSIELDGKPFVIVGIGASGFDGTEAQAFTDLWVPVTTQMQPAWLTATGSMILRVMGRVEPHRDRRPLEAAADAAFRRHLVAHIIGTGPAAENSVYRDRHMRLRPAAAGLTSLGLQYQQPLVILMLAVGVILLLCCANVANLLLARQQAREREFAVRLSLGAGRGRLARQLLTESVLVGAAGGLSGVLIAWAGAPALIALLPPQRIPLALNLAPTAAPLAFAAALAVTCAIVVGVLPAWRAARTPSASLTRTSRTIVHLRAGRGFVVFQIAGSLALLVVAGLMTRTLQNLHAVDIGFDPERITAFQYGPPPGFPVAARAALYARAVERLESTPGIDGVTYSQEAVFDAGGWAGAAAGPVADRVPATERDVAFLRVGPRFFDVLGERPLGGRMFAAADHIAGSRAIVVNETFARHFFGRDSAVEQWVDLNAAGVARFQIVGVVKDALHYGAREQPCGGRVVYFPIEVPAAAGTLYVRGSVSISDIGRIATEEARATGAEVLVGRLRPLTADVEAMFGQERLVGRLAGGFAILALGLSAIGLYGVMAYAVTQRTREIGVRAALGASPGTLATMVLGDTSRLVMAGVALGGLAAVYEGRLVKTLLFNVPAIDPTTLAVSAALLAVVALAAAYLPARRAARTDVTAALRQD